MEMLEMIKNRRSIRKYLPQRVEPEKLKKIQEAGIFAPNPGGGQGTKIIIVDNPKLIEKIGIVNANMENRNWGGRGVSADQPSIIDDLSIRSGFYGAPALGIVCVPRARKDQVNAIGSAFVCAQNMVMEAYDLGVSSCIVGRAEATFSQSGMQDMLDSWELDPEYMPMVFVCLGYVNGAYPQAKPRNEGRTLWVSD